MMMVIKSSCSDYYDFHNIVDHDDAACWFDDAKHDNDDHDDNTKNSILQSFFSQPMKKSKEKVS